MRIQINIIAILLLSAMQLHAQNEVNFTQFMHNKLALNPAYAGGQEVVTFTSLYRHQWAGLEGAPRTFSFNANVPFFNNRCGAGISLIADQIGFMKTYYTELSYAYRIKINETSKLSLGLQGRVEHGRTEWSRSDAFQQVDESIMMSDMRNTNFNFGFGAFYSNESFFVGASVPTLLKTSAYQESDDDIDNVSAMRSSYLMVGLVQRINKSLYLRPAVLATFNENGPFDLDINLSFLILEKFWLGASYRLEDSVDAIFQYQFNKQFKAGVAVDFPLTELQEYTAGGIELLLEYSLIFDKKSINNIRFF